MKFLQETFFSQLILQFNNLRIGRKKLDTSRDLFWILGILVGFNFDNKMMFACRYYGFMQYAIDYCDYFSPGGVSAPLADW